MHISLGTMHPGGRDKIPTSGKEPRDPLKAHLFKTAAASGRRYEERRAGPWFRVATTASRGQAVYCDRPSHSCVSRPSSDRATTASRDRAQTEPLLRLETELRPSQYCVSRLSSDRATTASRDRAQTKPLLRLETELRPSRSCVSRPSSRCSRETTGPRTP